MKKAHTILTIAVMLTIFSCKKDCNQTGTIVRDCTGTYIRVEGKDYHVCNLEKVASFSNGATVTAAFKKINDCKSSANEVVCYMLHTNEGWIEVDKIK